jgi:hypothetical protein
MPEAKYFIKKRSLYSSLLEVHEHGTSFFSALVRAS